LLYRLAVLVLAAALAACGDPGPEPEPRPPATPEPTATALPTPLPTQPPLTVLLVRHAEKREDRSADPGLTAAGRRRAQALLEMLRDSGITAVYATHFARTQLTVQPLARHLGLPVEVLQAPDVDGLLERIRSHAGGVVLVAGHSDSVVTLISRLGAGDVPPIQPDEYDNLYVLTVDSGGEARALRLHYGERGF
jgi:broad specificity phosphatase PhoE